MKLCVLLVTVVASVHSSIQGWSTTPAPGWPSTTTKGWSTTGWPSTTTKGWSTTPAPGWPSTTTKGWSTTGWPSTTTKGWSTTPAPGWPSTTTKGWSTTGWPSTTTKGWSTTPAPGWPSTTTKGWGGSKAGWDSTTTPGWGPQLSGWAGPSLSIADLYGQLSVAGAGWAAENHQDVAIAQGGWGVPAELTISSGGSSIVDQAGDISQVTQGESHQMNAVNVLGHDQFAGASENVDLSASGIDAAFAQSGEATSLGEGASESDGSTDVESNK